MTASTVLKELQALGVEVLVQGSNLIIRPASKVPPELKATLRERKPEILAVLTRRFDCVEISCADLPERTECPACRGYLWWHSVYGAVICARCHPPASPALVKSWWWGNIPQRKQ